eukprot:373291-Pyramimonas_sp.AAC.1
MEVEQVRRKIYCKIGFLAALERRLAVAAEDFNEIEVAPGTRGWDWASAGRGMGRRDGDVGWEGEGAA